MFRTCVYALSAAMVLGAAHASDDEPASTNRTVVEFRIPSPDLELPEGLQKPGLCASKSKEMMLNDSGLRSIPTVSVINQDADASLLVIDGSSLGN